MITNFSSMLIGTYRNDRPCFCFVIVSGFVTFMPFSILLKYLFEFKSWMLVMPTLIFSSRTSPSRPDLKLFTSVWLKRKVPETPSKGLKEKASTILNR